MRTVTYLQVCTLLQAVSCISGARILAVLPFPFTSHQFFYQAVLKVLANRGHEVVVYSPMPLQTPVPNYTDVPLNRIYQDDSIRYEYLLEFFASSKVAYVTGLCDSLGSSLEEVLNHENAQKLAKSKEHFDLVITETFVGQEALLVYGHIFKAPVITLHLFRSSYIENYVMGNSLALSYIPDLFFPYSNHMSLYERFLNTYSSAKTLYWFYNEHLPKHQAILDRTLKLKDAPPLSEMVQNISMIFSGFHPVVNYPRPWTPNIVMLGGIHLTTEKKPLPQDIQEFMDGATEGVIYFSLGTVVPENQLPLEFYNKFVSVFRQLNQRVLWKTRFGNITCVPKNVKIVKWAPQQDVLGHPKLRLFLTHGGLVSQLETMFAGVPVVAMPFFMDQSMNVGFYQERRVGVKLDFLTLTEDTISTAINTVLNNPRYKENALRESQIFRDLPMTQADSAVYWVEYVLRHKGAHHLRPASAHMTWYQRILLDVLAAVVLVAVMAALLMYYLCKRILFSLCSSTKKNIIAKKLN